MAKRETAFVGCDSHQHVAASYVDMAATGAGRVAEEAAYRKSAKYANFTATHIFQPVAVENLGSLNSSTLGIYTTKGKKNLKNNNILTYKAPCGRNFRGPGGTADRFRLNVTPWLITEV